MSKKYLSTFFLFLGFGIALYSCSEAQELPQPKGEDTTKNEVTELPKSHWEVLQAFKDNYTQLPEEAVSISKNLSTYAQYSEPTERYRHGIMGDAIEGGQLVVYQNGKYHSHALNNEFVFEDIRPRLFDVDGDSLPEMITIRSHVGLGAGIAIYKVSDDSLRQYAFLEEIGTANRWLNIVAIDDLNEDGQVELVWIQTPHIGGILKVATITPGKLTVLDEKQSYSNHSIGETNLCLSVLVEQNGQKVFYVPNQSRDKIVGFSYEDEQLIQIEEIDQEVDFSQTLNSQYNFQGVIEIEGNCINP